MATEIQLRRGTTAEHSSFTGAVGEVTVDTDKDTVVVHDNSQAGGYPLAKEKFSNILGYENVSTNASATGAVTVDLETATIFQHTLTGAVTYTFSNPPSSGTGFSFVIKVTQDATGSRTITWPSSVDWESGIAPTLSTGNGDVDVFAFFTTDGGTTYYGFVAGQDMT